MMKKSYLLATIVLLGSACTADHPCREGTVLVNVTFDDSAGQVDGIALRYRLDNGALVEMAPIARPMATREAALALEVASYGAHAQLLLQYAARKGTETAGPWQERLIDLQPGCTVVRLTVGSSVDGGLVDGQPIDATLVSRDGSSEGQRGLPPTRLDGAQAEAGMAARAEAGLDGPLDAPVSLIVDSAPDSPSDLGAEPTAGVALDQASDAPSADVLATGTGGATGGAVATGGSGGTAGTGGTATGGGTGTGGTATGGALGTGGVLGTGGNGTGGAVGTGGSPGTGGYVGTGGSPGTGGHLGTGGTPGTGGSPAECALGKTRCKSASIQQTCQPNLTWGGDQTCTYDCNTSTGSCCPDCRPTQTRCWTTSQEQVCDTTGHWPPPTDCGTGKECLTAVGACRKSNGQACTTAAECSSNVCGATFFFDEDGDSFGNPDVISKFCGDVPPDHWVTNNGDCCDKDGNARPTQTSFFTSPRVHCGGFDYNCDRESTRLFTHNDISYDCEAFEAYYGPGACTSWYPTFYWVSDASCAGGGTDYLPACGSGQVCGYRIEGANYFWATATYAMPCR